MSEVSATSYTGSGEDAARWYVHGVSYIDERLMMMNLYTAGSSTDDRPYYYTLDRMYNVRSIVDRAGAIIERYAYDPYGRPHIRESGGRGDMWDFGTITDAGDRARLLAEIGNTIWDARADLDDDGDVDATDSSEYNAKKTVFASSPTVSQAFSDVDNPYMFQGRPHFAIDTAANATAGKLMLNDHRARFADPGIGRWVTRDPLAYNQINVLLFSTPYTHPLFTAAASFKLRSPPTLDFRLHTSLAEISFANPNVNQDPSGLCCCFDPDLEFSKVCKNLVDYHATCTGTAHFPWPIGDIPLRFDLEDLHPTYTEECDGCEESCLPFPILILWPIDQSKTIEHSIRGFTITVEVNCNITSGWIILKTCCERATP